MTGGMSSKPDLEFDRNNDGNIRDQFWTIYEREAGYHVEEFLEKHKSDMDIVLIFSGLFSAVSTAFIVALQSELSPDEAQMTNALLKLLIHTLDNTTFNGQQPDLPQWNGPGATEIWIQCLMYASLSTSLIAALGAVLGKQWLGHFTRCGRGPIDIRGRLRQQKMDGLQTWHFSAVLEALPLLIQVSLLLFGIGLGASIWMQQPTIAAPVVLTMAFGALFYGAIVVSCIVSPTCPFQTATSTILRFALQNISRSMRKFYITLAGWVPPLVFGLASTSMPCNNARRYDNDRDFGLSHEVDALHDAFAVRWIMETTTDPNIITSAALMVPEVEWPKLIDVSAAIIQLRDTFLGCFESTQGRQPKLGLHSKMRALTCGKALIHLYFTRLHGRDMHQLFFDPLELVSATPVTATQPPDISWFTFLVLRDTEMQFICDMIRSAFRLSLGHHPFVPRIPDSYLAWMSYSIPHCLFHYKHERHLRMWAIDAITRLLVFPLPPRAVIVNCLTAAALMIGIPLEEDALIRLDRGDELESMLLQVLQGLQDRDLQATLKQGLSATSPNDPESGLEDDVDIAMLFRPLSVLIEVVEYRQIFRDNNLPVWALQLCRRMVQRANIKYPLNPIAADHQHQCLSSARAALHLSVIADADLRYRASDFGALWNCIRVGINHGKRRREDFTWLLDFIVHHRNTKDHLALGDALQAMSKVGEVEWPENLMQVYYSSICVAMSPDMPARTRHSGMAALHAVRKKVASDGLTSSMMVDLSLALSSTAALPIDPPVDDGPSHVLPLSESARSLGRDLCYTQIIFALLQARKWDEYLANDGHLERCARIATTLEKNNRSGGTQVLSQLDAGHLAFYLAGILAGEQHNTAVNIDEAGISTPMSTDELCWRLIRRAWAYAASQQLDEGVQCVVPILVQHTLRHMKGGQNVSRSMETAVLKVLVTLRSKQSVDADDDQVNELMELLGLEERVESMAKLHIGS